MNGYYQDIEENETENEYSNPVNTPTQIEIINEDDIQIFQNIITTSLLEQSLRRAYYENSIRDSRSTGTVVNETTPLLNNRNNNVYAETANYRRYLYLYDRDTPIQSRSDTESTPGNSLSTQPTNQNPNINNLIGSYNPRINSREILRRYYEIQDKNKKEILDSNGNLIIKPKNVFDTDIDR